MVERAAILLDGRCQRARGGTFHAFCAETLRRHADRIGFPQRFGILDTADAADVLDLARTRLGLDRLPQRFPKKRTLLAMYSAATNRGLPLAEVVAEGYRSYSSPPRHAPDAPHGLRRRQAPDGRHGLQRPPRADPEAAPRARRRPPQVAGRCRHVLVDEYQDVNLLQADLVEQFQSVHGNVTMVGDDASRFIGFGGRTWGTSSTSHAGIRARAS